MNDMTKGQIADLETIRFFIPDAMRHLEISEQDIKDFFELSEQGKHQERVGLSTMDGFNALVQGKRWRGIHMEMWENGVASSSKDPTTGKEYFESNVPYYTLLGLEDGEEPLPESVVKFMAKEMFKGADHDLIMGLYNSSKE